MTPDRAQIVQTIQDHRIVAIIRTASAAEAVERGELLVAAGIPVIEVALTTPQGLDVIATLAQTEDGRIVGAGTVLDEDTTCAAFAAGARFVVSPGLDEGVVREAFRLGIASMPGAATPTEVMRARSCGADFVKLFPASTYGPEYLRAIRVVFPDVAFVPTGGVDALNAAAWFDAGATALGVGSALSGGDPAKAQEHARDLLAAAAGPGVPAVRRARGSRASGGRSRRAS
jgi:2-dehydro-3-deoxyphosphogluconate aldolase/(4S)-4-hydroxy-2-oxoglutarate aldolase